MKTIVPFDNRKDSRGLPEGFDPHMFYEYRFQSNANQAKGVEWLLYKYIPFQIIKSFAIAIDPVAPFKVVPGVITEENRHKVRNVASLLQKRTMVFKRVNTSYAPIVNYNGVGGCRSPFTIDNPPYREEFSFEVSPQLPLPDRLSDTTSRTRVIGSEMGTLTLFKGFINSPAQTVYTKYFNQSEFNLFEYPPSDPCRKVGGTGKNRDGGSEIYSCAIEGPRARLSPIVQTALRSSEIAYNEGLIRSHAVAMLKGWSPMNRDYTFFRNLAELRDIPRSIRSLSESLLKFKQLYASLAHSPSLRKIIFDLKSAGKTVPGEYLSYHFGWKQTYKDVSDLLHLPYKMSKRINFLISRSGKPTTFRSKRMFVSGESNVSGFDYDTLRDEYLLDSTDGAFSRIERTSELRLVINATFDFPPISSAHFRYKLWLERAGINPRPTDVYNLIPFTWLVDYFTGLGNYVELIDNYNRDSSVINWGLITCSSKGKLITDFKSRSNRFETLRVNNELVSDTLVREVNRHTSIYDYECVTRRNVATILDVKTTSEPASLTDYQRSIIGALLAQRLAFSKRSGGFSPRT